MLITVGGDEIAVQRVDVSELFARRLANMGCAITWCYMSEKSGPLLRKREWYGQPAYVYYRSGLPGTLGRIVTKISELRADLLFFVLALRRSFDIIQVRDKFMVAVLGLIAARLKRVPFVYWLSYPFPEARLTDVKKGHSKYPWYSWSVGKLEGWLLYRIILPMADLTFVQSEQMKRDVERRWYDNRKLIPIPMGIPDENLPNPAELQRAKEPLILYLGTLNRVRKLEMIVRAFVKVLSVRPDARLVFVGDGNAAEDRSALETEVERLGLRDNVLFTGQLSREEALAWVRRAMVCLSPFYPTFELLSTSPTKLIEYMAFGKAVVANDHPEQAEVIAQSGAGLLTAWNEEEFADAIIQLLNDPEGAVKMGRLGYEWVRDNRKYSRIADIVYEHYKTMLKEYTHRYEQGV